MPLPANVVGASAIWAHAFRVTAPALPSTVTGGGAVVQVTAVSVQAAVTVDTLPPTGLASVVKRRSCAAVTGPVRPATVKRRRNRYSGVGARTWSVVCVPKFLLGDEALTRASADAVKVDVAARAGDWPAGTTVQAIASSGAIAT